MAQFISTKVTHIHLSIFTDQSLPRSSCICLYLFLATESAGSQIKLPFGSLVVSVNHPRGFFLYDSHVELGHVGHKECRCLLFLGAFN